jgi:hypothetical protein
LSSGKAKKSAQEARRLPAAAANMRIGLLGGTFNPPHQAHLEISRTALKRLGLDQVWWFVTPGNPLKDVSDLPELTERVAAARAFARHPRIVVSGFGRGEGVSYTVDLLTALKRRYRGVNFVWLMGADNLPAFHHWRDWQRIFRAGADRGIRPAGVPAESPGEQGGTALLRLSDRRIRCARTCPTGPAGMDRPYA